MGLEGQQEQMWKGSTNYKTGAAITCGVIPIVRERHVKFSYGRRKEIDVEDCSLVDVDEKQGLLWKEPQPFMVNSPFYKCEDCSWCVWRRKVGHLHK